MDKKGFNALAKSIEKLDLTTAEKKIPVCTLWGTADKTMPYYQSKQLKEIFPEMSFYTFEDSGHIFLFDEGEKTCKIILDEMNGIKK